MASKPTHPVEDRLECFICLEEFTDPRMLPCLHTMCRDCIEDLVSSASGQKFQCPACRYECKVPKEGVSGFPKNFFLNDVKELLQELNKLKTIDAQGESRKHPGQRECDNAKKDTKAHGGATTFCADCEEFYCETCASYHRMLGVSCHHQLSPASEADTSTVLAAKLRKRILKCGEHPDVKLDFYCDTCRIPVCSKCCLLKHKQHQYRDLTAVGKAYQKKLEEHIQAAEGHLIKVHGQLKGLKASALSIQRDTDEARLQVKQAANNMRDLVTKREQHLLHQIQDIQQEALAAVKSAQEESELKEKSTADLLSYMQALHDSGDVTDQVVHTPVLEEQLHQQQAAPLREVNWSVCLKEETNSVDALNVMLGTVTVDHGLATSSAAAMGGEGMKLYQPLSTLNPNVEASVSGLVVANHCVCATAWFRPHLYVYNTCTKEYKRQSLKGLEAAGIAAIHGNTLSIADLRKRLHFVTFSQQNMKFTRHTVQDLTFEPRDITFCPDTGQLVIADNTNKAVVICDTRGNIQRSVKVQTDVGTMHCAVVSNNGYVVLNSSDEGRGLVHWLDSQGRVMHTYGHRDGEGLCRPCHMVRTNQGQLVVADSSNDRLHLIDTSGRLLCYLLTKDDGIQHPVCVWLEETTSLLYVAHRPGDYSDPREIRVYKWPTAAPRATPNPISTHTVHIRVGTYK